MSWGLMKAGSDLCLFLPVGVESSEQDSLMILWMVEMLEVSMKATWVSIATEVMVMVIKGVPDVYQLNQISWIWYPCCWCPSGWTWFSPFLAWGS